MSYPEFYENVILKVVEDQKSQKTFEDELRVAGGNDAVFMMTLSSILSTV